MSIAGFRTIGIAATLLASIATANAESQTGSCSPTKVRFVSSEGGGFAFYKHHFKTIPETGTVSFVQGGAGPSCVIVTFSAQLFLDTFHGTVRAVMDSEVVAEPAEAPLSVQNLGTHTSVFMFPNVASGPHVIRMQVRKTSGDDVVSSGEIEAMNVVVRHAP